ncbi:TetR/AcrR family transcriptional regulator [Aquisalimonas lutea]|uniref:TetR/AcrR family transcriptional regulator n=1 Tax=Aquisalimonas lutea TaxID=1327750 RepID=UPI0025B4DE65|nr:TetR/AcrR family transcriptional regulator [Aquisalimonas lutea]MDN3519715.1 TetR/AcrR family transcriptional regulator [Aquisalimonas lutea]
MNQPRVQEKEATSRRIILDCAARLFRTEGYAATSLRRIAAASNMKSGSLYYHFASKEEIITEVLNMGVQRVHDEVWRSTAELPPDADSHTLVRTAVRAHLAALHELGDYSSANVRIYGQVPEHVRNAHKPIRIAYEDLWIALLGRCVSQGSLRGDVSRRFISTFMLGAMNASLEWGTPESGRLQQMADDMAELFLRGIMTSNQ